MKSLSILVLLNVLYACDGMHNRPYQYHSYTHFNKPTTTEAPHTTEPAYSYYQQPRNTYYGYNHHSHHAPSHTRQKSINHYQGSHYSRRTTTPKPATKTPEYLGKFSNPTHDVEGDIFKLDEHTLYIQGFSFDGQAPDVYFWSDGVAIPFYTRSNPHMTMNVEKFDKEDVVLMLPPEKPTLSEMGHFEIWCKQYDITFGAFEYHG